MTEHRRFRIHLGIAIPLTGMVIMVIALFRNNPPLIVAGLLACAGGWSWFLLLRRFSGIVITENDLQFLSIIGLVSNSIPLREVRRVELHRSGEDKEWLVICENGSASIPTYYEGCGELVTRLQGIARSNEIRAESPES